MTDISEDCCLYCCGRCKALFLERDLFIDHKQICTGIPPNEALVAVGTSFKPNYSRVSAAADDELTLTSVDVFTRPETDAENDVDLVSSHTNGDCTEVKDNSLAEPSATANASIQPGQYRLRENAYSGVKSKLAGLFGKAERVKQLVAKTPNKASAYKSKSNVKKSVKSIDASHHSYGGSVDAALPAHYSEILGGNGSDAMDRTTSDIRQELSDLGIIGDTVEITIETMDEGMFAISEVVGNDGSIVLNFPSSDDTMQRVELPVSKKRATTKSVTKAYQPRNAAPKAKDYSVSVENGIESYRCTYCQYSTLQMGRLGRHLASHNEDGVPFRCDKCSFTSLVRSVFAAHCKKHEKCWMCSDCQYRATSERDLKRHHMRHSGELPLKCPHCAYTCRQKHSMLIHRRKHSGQFFHCDAPGCNYQSPNVNTLQKHKTRHSAVKYFTCATCGYSTNARTSFDKHIKMHLGLKDNKCPYCDYKSITVSDIKRHMKRHMIIKAFNCDRCTYATAHESALRAHLMGHEGLKPYRCNICPYNSSTKVRVKRHIGARHALMPNAAVLYNGIGLKINFQSYKNKEAKFLDEPVLKLKYGTEETTAITVDDNNGVQSVEKLRTFVVETEGEDTAIATYQCSMCKYSCRSEAALATHKISYHSDSVVEVDGIGNEDEARSSEALQDDAAFALASLQSQVELTTS